jgi:glutathione S-transferase
MFASLHLISFLAGALATFCASTLFTDFPTPFSNMAPKYRLNYFDARGRAEFIRWIFAYAGVDYEDNRVPREQWPALKATAPFGQMPFLEVDGKPLPQSNAIARFVARKHGVAGKDDWEAACADALVDYIGDAMKPLAALYGEQDEKKKAEIKAKFIEELVQPYLKGLERKLQENNNGEGFFVGDKPTWADFVIVNGLDNLVAMGGSVLETYPLLKAHSQRVHDLKGIKEWLLKRPVTAM